MGSTSIKHHFLSFVEHSKQVKIKIDSTLELLSEYVYDEYLPKDQSATIDVSSMLELNELFTLVDTFLTEFQKSLLRIEVNVEKNKNLKEKKSDEYFKTLDNTAKHENIPCLPNNHPNNNTINETNCKGIKSNVIHRHNHVSNEYNCQEAFDSANGREVCINDNDCTINKEENVSLNKNEHIDDEISQNFQISKENIPAEKCSSEKIDATTRNVEENIVPDVVIGEKENVKINEHAQTNKENSVPDTTGNKLIQEKVPVENRTHTKKTHGWTVETHTEEHVKINEYTEKNEENSIPDTTGNKELIEEKVPVGNETHGGTVGTPTNKKRHTKQFSELKYDFDSDSYYSATSSDYTSDVSSSKSNVSEGKLTNIERKTLLQLNKTYKVSIKHVENLNTFFVYVMTDSTKEFFKKWETMAKFYKRHSKDKAYFLSEACLEKDCNIFVAVLYKSRWCRGRVIDYHSRGFNLYLIDFGNRIESKIDACRHLKSQFHFPSVLQNMCLNLRYSSTRQALFDALVKDEVIYEVRCVKQIKNSFQVIIQEMSGISINDIIESIETSEMDERSTVDAVAADFENSDNGLEDFDPMKEDFFAETNDYNINPDNACQAVIGYIPNDDQRFCKFGKTCRKKKCFRLHQEQDPNGWTKDTEIILTRSYDTADLPQNELVPIEIISVVNIGEFYAHLEQNIEPNDDEETFESLSEYMNKVENVQAMKKLRTQPARGEILIACYRGYYYRCKVLSYAGENDTCEVFFVDIGVSEYVKLKDLRQMESKYNHLPFQAFHFSIRQQLEFTIPLESEHYDLCLALFRGLVQFKSFHCVIQSSITDPADILLFTKDQIDIVEYYSKCCKRILGEDEESSSVYTSSISGTSIGGLDIKDMMFVPA